MDLIPMLIFGLLGLLACGGVGCWVGRMNGRGQDGFLLGLFLGPIGWIIVACLPKGQRTGPSTGQKFARPGGQWAGAARPGPLSLEARGVKLRCPNCGEEGFVPEVKGEIVCPTCSEKFVGEKNLARTV